MGFLAWLHQSPRLRPTDGFKGLLHWLGPVSVLGTLLLPALVHAGDAFYLGTWKFADAVVAPWVVPGRRPDGSEAARLSGKTVRVTAKEIAGPQPFPCKKPRYKLVEYPADWLFQGAFGEMRDRDGSIDPAMLAAALGFRGAKVRTLETGCELDFHFVDESTAEVGLNDYVYTLKKQ
jgi:hypothetical protein